MSDYDNTLNAAGIDRKWGDACLDSAHALQGYYQKRGIELARLDPACDGYSYWTIVDVMVPQGKTYTGQGFLNAFWEEKPGGLTLDQFRRFNGPTAILAKHDSEPPIAVSGQICKIALFISHFAPEAIEHAHIEWKISISDGESVSGLLGPFNAAPGDTKEIGICEFEVPDLKKPCRAVFEAALPGMNVVNSWDYWFFPKRLPAKGDRIAATDDIFDAIAIRYPGCIRTQSLDPAHCDLVIGSWDHPDLIKATRNGIRGLMIGPADGDPNVSLGWWSLGNQIGTVFANHPVFGDFPHNGKLTPLWFRLIKRGLPLPLSKEYGTLEHFAVGEGQEQYFSYVCQRKGPNGERLLITHGVDLLADTPEGAYLMDEMIRYVRSDEFTESAGDGE